MTKHTKDTKKKKFFHIKKTKKNILLLTICLYTIILCVSICYFAIRSVTPKSINIVPLKKKDKPSHITYRNSSDICREIFKCYNEGVLGPMMCVKGTLHSDVTNTNKEVYWIFLGGLEKVKNQTTTMKDSILSGLNLNNTYKKNVKKHILENIPINSTLILSGHSLGGMVSQQLASDKEIREKYTISHIIGFGSPYISTDKKEGSLIRFADNNDPIGYITFFNPFKYKRKENKIISKKSSYFIKEPAHLYSYNDKDIWKDYDVLGSKNNHTTFSFIEEEKVYFKSLYK